MGRGGPDLSRVAQSAFPYLELEAFYRRLVNGHALANLDNIVSQRIDRIRVAVQALFHCVKSLVEVAYEIVETGIHRLETPIHCLETRVHFLETGVRLLTCSLEASVDQIKTPIHLFNCCLKASVNQIKSNINDIKAGVHSHKVAYTRYDNGEHRYNGGYTPSIPVQPFPHDPDPLSNSSGGFPPRRVGRRLCCAGAL